MKYSDLDKNLNLSPKFYDFKSQYNSIAKELENTSIEIFENKIKNILEDKQLKNLKLNTEVLNNLKNYFNL